MTDTMVTGRDESAIVPGRSTRAQLELGVTVLAVASMVGCAAAALTTDGEIEPFVLMVGGVIAALSCFDRSLDRATSGFWPWLLFSLAVLAKVVPTIVVELAEEGSLSVERYDQLGSVLAGLIIALAMLALALPSDAGRGFVVLAVVVLSGTVSGAAGATIGFVEDPAYQSTLAARVLETGGWAAVGLIMSAAGIAAVVPPAVTRSLLGVIAVAAAAAVLVALASSGVSIDVGWWLVSWVGLTIAALHLGAAPLGARPARTRRRGGVGLVAETAGFAAVAAVLWTEIDRATWDPGWLVLTGAGLLLALLAVVVWMGEKRYVPPDAPAGDERDDSRVVSAEERRAAPPAVIPRVVPADEPFEPGEHIDAADAVEDDAPRVSHDVPRARSPAADPATDATAAPAAPADDAQRKAPAPGVAPDGATDPEPVPDSSPVRQRVAHSTPVSERLAALLEPHHIDPRTGLLSAAGLQLAVKLAFADPRDDGEVALLMIALRNLDEIERAEGRLVAGEVTAGLGRSLQSALPASICARHSRIGFAALMADYVETGTGLDRVPAPTETIDRFTDALLTLLEGVEVRGRVVAVDVVGGMAQCYADEEAAKFVDRANRGLEQAVRSAEPTLVSMP